MFDNFDYSTSGFIYGEDLFFLLNLLPHLNSILILDEIGYNYRYGGMSSKYNPQIFIDLNSQFYYKLNLLNELKYKTVLEPLFWELKEICKSEIVQKINLEKCTKDELILYLTQEKQKPYYQLLLQKKKPLQLDLVIF